MPDPSVFSKAFTQHAAKGFILIAHLDVLLEWLAICVDGFIVRNTIMPVGLLDKSIQRIILLAVCLEDSLVWMQYFLLFMI